MLITISRELKTSLYRQIMTQIIEQIDQGILLPGEKLMSERKLASQLKINRSTVVRAYDELHSEGFVERKANSGTYVLSDDKQIIYGEYWRKDIFQKHENETKQFNYSEGIRTRIKNNEGAFIDAYSGELPSKHLPNISIPSLKWQEFLNSDVSEAGYLPLRKHILSLMKAVYDYQGEAQEIMLTAGGQQSLVLLLQALLKPGDTIIIEKPSFFSSMSLFQSMAINVIEVNVDQDGLLTSEIGDILERRSVSLVLTNPNFQNPTGSQMSLIRRQELIKLCRMYRLPIIEDDVFGQLLYDTTERLPLLKQMAPELVIYLGSLSKIMGKKIQIGWICAPNVLLDSVIKIRDEYESELNVFPQIIATHILEDTYFFNYLNDLRSYLASQNKCLSELIEKSYGELMVYHPVKGGYYAWLTVKGRKFTEETWLQLLEKNIGVFPSYLVSEDSNSCRINLARINRDEIKMILNELKKCVLGDDN